MIQEYHEDLRSEFKGTIMDIETIGDFDRAYPADSRRFRFIQQVILGYINQSHLHIYCAVDDEDIEKLRVRTPEILATLERPYYAFNCEFESGVWFHHAGIELHFDGELQGEKYESKKNAVKVLKIANYDDPFFDLGYLCMQAWNNQEYEKAIEHNRACLLKERDILVKRGHCQASRVRFMK